MNRHGYTDDCDGDTWSTIRWRGAVKKAIKGKRGQAFLRELLAALDELPEKFLVESKLENEDGGVCAIGAVCKRRGIKAPEWFNDEDVDPGEYRDALSEILGIAPVLISEIAYENDEGNRDDESRFRHMRSWVQNCIKQDVSTTQDL